MAASAIRDRLLPKVSQPHLGTIPVSDLAPASRDRLARSLRDPPRILALLLCWTVHTRSPLRVGRRKRRHVVALEKVAVVCGRHTRFDTAVWRTRWLAFGLGVGTAAKAVVDHQRVERQCDARVRERDRHGDAELEYAEMPQMQEGGEIPDGGRPAAVYVVRVARDQAPQREPLERRRGRDASHERARNIGLKAGDAKGSQRYGRSVSLADAVRARSRFVVEPRLESEVLQMRRAQHLLYLGRAHESVYVHREAHQRLVF